MKPIVTTTRLRQAISSAQQFVQRVFLNLEQQVTLEREDKGEMQERWEFLKSYRVWEAYVHAGKHNVWW